MAERTLRLQIEQTGLLEYLRLSLGPFILRWLTEVTCWALILGTSNGRLSTSFVHLLAEVRCSFTKWQVFLLFESYSRAPDLCQCIYINAVLRMAQWTTLLTEPDNEVFADVLVHRSPRLSMRPCFRASILDRPFFESMRTKERPLRHLDSPCPTRFPSHGNHWTAHHASSRPSDFANTHDGTEHRRLHVHPQKNHQIYNFILAPKQAFRNKRYTEQQSTTTKPPPIYPSSTVLLH